MSTIANMLYNRTTKLLREGEIGTFETRFYSSDTPNEKYRIGQKHVKGKIVSIRDQDYGFSFNVDISTECNGQYNSFAITQKYIDMCHIKCIVFAIDSITLDGVIEHKEIAITADEWVSTNTYITTGIVDESTEQYSYNIGDIVKLTYNTSEEKNIKCIAKILKIATFTDSSDELFYKITFDGSTEYNFNQFILNEDEIVGIKLYKKPVIERPWEDD